MSTPEVAKPNRGRSYAGRSSAERREARRAALIDAGISVFGRDGFRSATVKSICREAGLTERYFYESFANSEALFAAVYKSLIAAIEAEMLAAIEAEPADAEATARAGLRVYFGRMADPLIARIVLIEIFGISADIDRTYRAVTLNFARLTEELTARLFDVEAITAGADSRLLSMGLVGSTIHIAMYWHLNGYRESLDTVVESALRLYLAMAGNSAH
ncbi:TetR/AcrR family transcriptional regulator [Salinisphaera hydrothermalis]|uniref:TetR family transcriptional regulator n=1 Tax=Salinisphaera hydrothermalis (strain C41B8) TaxID=1304275 RepID=A0A084IR53_SALHC|nr:TetR/AcrR family transcriptional regulator [Salinisphaera hydrothermalis]KEZ79187.1 TetR family transcriptional regulator [Salinisphaera hydrothermalis C41B8]